MGNPALDSASGEPRVIAKDDAAVLAKVRSDVTRYLAAQIIADPNFPNRKTLPKLLPLPFCNFGHQLLVDYERLLRIVWKVALEARTAVMANWVKRSALKWMPLLVIPAIVGVLLLSIKIDDLDLILTAFAIALTSAGGMGWMMSSTDRAVAKVRARALHQLLEDRFGEGERLIDVERHHVGDGALDGPAAPVLTVLTDGAPFPGFGTLQADNLFVCPPKAGARSRAVIDLARTIRDQVAAIVAEQTDVVIRRGEVIVLYGGKLSMDSAWLGPDKAPILWFPRAELQRVQDVDPRASVRVFHATQMVFAHHATAATIFLRVFPVGNSIALKISATTLGPPAGDETDLLARVCLYKLEKRKPSSPRMPSQSTSPAEHEALECLERADLTRREGATFQNDVDVAALREIDLGKEQNRGFEYDRLFRKVVADDPLWPGRKLGAQSTLREQYSLPFLTDFFGRPESIAHVHSVYHQIVRRTLEKIDAGGFDTSQYRDDLHARSMSTRIVPETAQVHGPEAMRAERTAVRALVLAANPPETVRLRIDQEIRSIDEAIRRGRYRDRFDLVAQLAVREEDLHGHLLRYQPEILHFAGHGEVGALIFEDGQGRARPLEAEDLRALIALLGRRIRCVVLNACLTRSQAEILARHVPSVIGMSRAIDDPLAIEFAIGFYEALAYGESVKTAFELGSQRIAHYEQRGALRDLMAAIDAPPSANAPVLLGNADPREIRFF